MLQVWTKALVPRVRGLRLWNLTTRAGRRGGGGGLDEVDRGGRGLREAVPQYLDAIESEPGHSWLSAAAHAM